MMVFGGYQLTNYLRGLYYLRALQKSAFWERSRLLEYQNSRLRAVVRHAYETSVFYHEKFKQANLKPADIRTRADLNRLPIVRKAEITNNVEKVVSSKFSIRSLKMTRTSGSTGKPLIIYMTQKEDEYRKAKHLRAQIVLGQKPWHRWVTITSPLHFAETTQLQRLFRLYGVYPLSVFENIDTQLSKIEKLRPDVLDGYSNSILLIAKEVSSKGARTVNPKILVSGAELIGTDSRKFVEGVFGAPFYDQYGSNEFERLAWQCRQKSDYHIDADSVIMQFVDENGEEVSPGEEGEVVCTSLFSYAMPFIRYGLDDIGIPSESTECACGRTLPLMKIIEGRKNSLLSFPDGRVIAPFAFLVTVWMFKHYDSIDLFRVVQKRKDLIIFKLKLKEKTTDEEKIRRDLQEHVRNVLDLSPEVAVETEFVDDIPLDSNGKFRIVISEASGSI
jgi:phenylacetate-CoA ligase